MGKFYVDRHGYRLPRTFRSAGPRSQSGPSGVSSSALWYICAPTTSQQHLDTRRPIIMRRSVEQKTVSDLRYSAIGQVDASCESNTSFPSDHRSDMSIVFHPAHSSTMVARCLATERWCQLSTGAVARAVPNWAVEPPRLVTVWHDDTAFW